MKHNAKFLVLGVVCALMSVLVAPMMAQEADPGAGNGGLIIESNIGDDPSTYIPLIGSDTTSSSIYDKFYPTIIGLDDVTLQPTPGVPQSMAAGWEYDETGTILTLNLRDDLTWSDGTPITADDYLWAFNATASGEINTPRTSALYQLADGTVTDGTIHSATKIDDFTIEFRLGTVVRDDEGSPVVGEDGQIELAPNCEAINDINDITPVPAHVYEPTFGEDLASMEDDPYFVPQTEGGIVGFGPFFDPFTEPGVQVSLLGNQTYSDSVLGYVAPQEWLLQNVEDQTVAYQRFLAGDFTTLGVSADNQNSLRASIEAGEADFQIIEYPANGYTYMGYNTADPNNPQPGRDAEGNLIDQGIHPIFGDINVRQAIAYAVDVRSIIGTQPDGDNPATGILEGNGFEIATHNHPGLSSTDDELADLGVEPYAFDPVLADEILVEAGWVDADGNGVRECQGCLYATEVDPSFEGTEMSFELLTNAGNVLREATGETIKSQLAEVGIFVDFQAIEFGTLVDELLGQQFDAIIIGWSLGLPFYPGGGLSAFFGVGNDRPGAGFNTGSIQVPELDELVELADSLPAAEDGSYEACDPAQRDVLYAQAQQIVWEQQPYLFLYAGNVMVATQANVANYDPLPYNTQWNLDAWTVEG